MKSLSPTAARSLACGAGLVIGFLAACGPFNPPSTDCTRDADCGLDTLHCNAQGHCVERCDYPEHWCGNSCALCCDDRACAPYGHCTTAGTCEPNCGGGQRFCVLDAGAGTCAECCSDADCGSRGPCVQGQCGCLSSERLCGSRCIPRNACCDQPNDCEGGWECDGGYCCNYTQMDDGGIVGCEPRAP